METIENNNHQQNPKDKDIEIELEEIKESGLSYFLKSENTSSSRRFVAGIGDETNEINKVGCAFFLNANNDQITRISSYQLRWLTHKCDKGKDNVQIAAKERIRNENGQNPPNFKMKILLYSDPTKLKDKTNSEIDNKLIKEHKKENDNEIDNEHIKRLLRCKGVKIRYMESEEQLLRISMMGPWLFLSMSDTQDDEVDDSVLYEAKDGNSTLLEYFRKRFEHDFNQADEIILDENDRIVFKDNWSTRFRKWCKSDHGINVIGIWIGIVGVIMTILGLVITIRGCFR